MCAVSLVIGDWTNPVSPNFVPFTPTFPSPNLAQEMLTVITKLEEIDRRLKAIDCKLEDKAKRKYKERLQRRANKRPALRR